MALSETGGANIRFKNLAGVVADQDVLAFCRC